MQQHSPSTATAGFTRTHELFRCNAIISVQFLSMLSGFLLFLYCYHSPVTMLLLICSLYHSTPTLVVLIIASCRRCAHWLPLCCCVAYCLLLLYFVNSCAQLRYLCTFSAAPSFRHTMPPIMAFKVTVLQMLPSTPPMPPPLCKCLFKLSASAYTKSGIFTVCSPHKRRRHTPHIVYAYRAYECARCLAAG